MRILRVITRLNIGGPSIQALALTSRLAARGATTTLLHGRLGEGEGDMRYLAAPDANLQFVPTLHEQGLKDFEVAVWHGLYVAKGTPKPVLDKLNLALNTAIKDPQFKDSMAKLGAEPVSADRATPESLAKHLKAEIEKWGPVIQKAGLYAD